MSRICSSCGQYFDGVICEHCDSKNKRAVPTIITVKRPVKNSETKPPPKPESFWERWRRKLSLLLVKRREESEAKEAKEASAADQSEGETPLTPLLDSLSECGRAIGYYLSGAARQTVQFVVSAKGRYAWIFLGFLCFLVPLFMGVSLTLLTAAGAEEGLLASIAEAFSVRFVSFLINSLILWAELSALLFLLLRFQAFVMKGRFKSREVISLITVAQLPLIVWGVPCMLSLLISPFVTLIFFALSVFQLITVLYMGVEYAFFDRRKGVFNQFFILVLIFLIFALLLIFSLLGGYGGAV
ncbi:MAG: hypothetical protein LBL82_02580 [Oscillospiraceae bacterium]|jgi:hypothetical protein|nr:hypothetical protein [Oscillospiraceae bacterium]